MNSNFDDLLGVYGAVQYSALSELSHVFGTGKRMGMSWQRVAMALAVIATPVALLLLAGGLGS